MPRNLVSRKAREEARSSLSVAREEVMEIYVGAVKRLIEEHVHPGLPISERIKTLAAILQLADERIPRFSTPTAGVSSPKAIQKIGDKMSAEIPGILRTRIKEIVVNRMAEELARRRQDPEFRLRVERTGRNLSVGEIEKILREELPIDVAKQVSFGGVAVHLSPQTQQIVAGALARSFRIGMKQVQSFTMSGQVPGRQEAVFERLRERAPGHAQAKHEIGLILADQGLRQSLRQAADASRGKIPPVPRGFEQMLLDPRTVQVLADASANHELKSALLRLKTRFAK